MRTILYNCKGETPLCDNCGKVLSEDGKGKPYLSIKFGEYSGWVEEQPPFPDKKVFGIKQFCNGKCLATYFNKLKT